MRYQTYIRSRPTESCKEAYKFNIPYMRMQRSGFIRYAISNPIFILLTRYFAYMHFLPLHHDTVFFLKHLTNKRLALRGKPFTAGHMHNYLWARNNFFQKIKQECIRKRKKLLKLSSTPTICGDVDYVIIVKRSISNTFLTLVDQDYKVMSSYSTATVGLTGSRRKKNAFFFFTQFILKLLEDLGKFGALENKKPSRFGLIVKFTDYGKIRNLFWRLSKKNLNLSFE